MGLDALELLMQWEETFGVEFDDDEAMAIETPEMAIALISARVGASEDFIGICPIMRVYHCIREEFQATLGLKRQHIRLNSKLRDLLPKAQRREIWTQLCSNICSELDIPKLPSWGLGVGLLFAPITIQDLVDWVVTYYPKRFVNPQKRWTHFQVRSVVRAVIREVAGVSDFKDDCSFRELCI